MVVPGNHIAMDESPVQQDMLSDTTVDSTGIQSVGRIPICLAAQVHGTKLKPVIVFAGAKRGRAVTILLSPNARTNNNLTRTGLQMYWRDFHLASTY